MENFTIRNLTRSEMQLAISWADREGWNPGIHDEECFYSADQNGFFAGLLGNKIVSIISAVKYDNNYGFVGFYIVEPEYRGKGYGIAIWKKAMEYLEGYIIGLDGVPEQVKNYKKSGFEYAHRNISFKGNSKKIKTIDNKVKELSFDDFKMIREYDLQFMPDSRDDFLRCWLSHGDSCKVGIVENDYLKAFGKIRKCNEGYKIGPLFADDSIKAKSVFLELQNKIPEGSSFTIDIPESNEDSLKMAKDFEMEYFFETARMYKGEIPNLPLNKIFGITTYEVG